MKKLILALSLMVPLGVLPITGCAHQASAPTPPLVDQVNAFDGQTYRTLITLQGSLNSLKSSIAADQANLGSLKPALNQATADYNVAMTFWKTYHAAAKAGAPADQQGTADALAKVEGDVKSLQAEVKK